MKIAQGRPISTPARKMSRPCQVILERLRTTELKTWPQLGQLLCVSLIG